MLFSTKNKKINRFFTLIFFSVFLFTINPTNSFAQSKNINFFISEYQNIFKIMLDSYKEEVKEPLDGRLFNIRDSQVSSFVKKATRMGDRYHFLSMWYRNIKVNNNPTNFCFIVYDSKEMMQLDRYLNSSFPSNIDAIYYLAAHELGHCLIAHQRSIGNLVKVHNAKAEELYAEIFSVAFFLSRNQTAQALAIINQNKHLDKNSNHYNPEKLKKAFVLFNQEKPEIRNMYDLYNVSYKYYEQIESDPELLNEELEVKAQLFEEGFRDVHKSIFASSRINNVN